MKRRLLITIFFGLALFLATPMDVGATCAGSYDCAGWNSFSSSCTAAFAGGGFCSGPNNTCDEYAGNTCPHGCVLNDGCNAQCSYSPCDPNDGHSCSPGQLYIDLGGVGQTSCTGSSGCFTSPGCSVPTNTPPPGATNTPQPGPTNTPIPPTPTPICTIQGRKVIMPGNQQIAPAVGQTVTVPGYGTDVDNPFGFTVPGNQSRTASVSTIAGYSTGYTLCTGSTGCHTGTITNGSTTTSFNCPAGSYADLWWHYTPNTPTPTPTRNSTCVSHTIPTSMTPNNDYPVSVTMNNSGNTTWSSTSPAYLLGSSDPQANTVWGLSSTPLDTTPVNPGQNTTFNFTISSPSTPGTYSSRWRMFQNTITWFGAECGPTSVVVANPTPVPTTTPSCTISTPTGQFMGVNSTSTLTVNVTSQTGGTIDRVTFSSNASRVSVTSPDTSPASFTSTMTSNSSAGDATVTVNAYMNGNTTTVRCSDTTLVTVQPGATTPPSPTPSPCVVTTSPANMSLDIGGDTGTVTASVTSGLGSASVTSMDFGSYNANIVTVPSADDTSSPFTTTVTSQSTLGNTAVWATATLSDGRTCQSSGTTDTDVEVIPVCSVSIPSTVSMATNSTSNLVASIGAQSGGTVTRVAFSSSNTSRVTATSPDDSPSPSFSSTLTSNTNTGPATVTATAFMNNNNADMICSDTTTVTVAAGPTATPAPDCDLSLGPANATIGVGGTVGLTATLSNIVGTVDRVTFSSSNTADVTVSPATDSSGATYATVATGVSSGSSIVTATCYLQGSTGTPRGTDTSTITVNTSTPVPTVTGVPCGVTLNPSSAALTVGGPSTTLTATVQGLNGAGVIQMAFGSYDTDVVTVNPTVDNSFVYSTSATAVGAGSSAVWATASLNDGRTCETVAGTDADIIVSGPTPTSVAPRVWTITTSPYCSTGGGVNTSLRMFSYLGPTTAPVYSQDALSPGDHSMVITSNQSTDVVWVGMKDSSGDSYEATAINPTDPDVSFGQDFTPAVWTAQWNRGNLPAGSYTVDIEVVPSAPGAPSGLTSSVAGNSADLDWVAPGSWGLACNQNNTYKLYLSQEAAGYSGYPTNPQCNTTSCSSTPTQSGIVASDVTRTIVAGTRYCWVVRANNGSLDGPISGWNCFDSGTTPWWQAVGGDAVGASGSLTTNVPSGEVLVDRIGTAPAGMAFGTGLGGNLSRATGNISSPNNWFANLSGFSWTTALAKPENGYDSMRERLVLHGSPAIVSGTVNLDNGGTAVTINGSTYNLYQANGSVTINAGADDTLSRKVILIVDGAGSTLNIEDNISLSGTGFLFTLVENDITLNSAVTLINGIFWAGGVFDTNTGQPLAVNGSAIGMGGVNLDRSGAVGTAPAEIFTFYPNLTMELSGLGLRKKVIQELVNP